MTGGPDTSPAPLARSYVFWAAWVPLGAVSLVALVAAMPLMLGTAGWLAGAGSYQRSEVGWPDGDAHAHRASGRGSGAGNLLWRTPEQVVGEPQAKCKVDHNP